MIRNYLFDLYGTLVDIRTDETMPALWTRLALLLSLQGATYAPEELQKAYLSLVAEETERQADRLPDDSKCHAEPEIRSVFRALYVQKDVTVSKDTAEASALIFRTLSLRHLKLYPGAKEVLETLRVRGCGVYLLSNAQAAFTMPELGKLELTPLFDGIVLSSDAGVKKPDRAIFQHILSKYGLRPEECLMVGNDAEADIRGAAGAGVRSRYIHSKQSPARSGELPEGCREIHSLRELL